MKRKMEPDVINQYVQVSSDGGRSWAIDQNLTNQVTRNGALRLYDNDPYRMQLTQISFDPYNANRIVVGTRDAGVIVTEASLLDGGHPPGGVGRARARRGREAPPLRARPGLHAVRVVQRLRDAERVATGSFVTGTRDDFEHEPD